MGNGSGSRLSGAALTQATQRARNARTTGTRAPKPPKPPTAAQRNKQATVRLLSALAGTDQTAALAVALESIADQLERDTTFRESLRQKYAELAALSAPKPKPEPRPKPEIRNPEAFRGYNPVAKLDPYQYAEGYGLDQLRAVLESWTQKALRDGVDMVQARHPGTKAKSRSSNAAMIDYIMEHVAPGF